VFLADAAISGAAGVLMIAGAGLLGPFLELPEPLLFWAGIVLVPYVALLLALARRAAAPRLFIMDVVLINGLWVAASFGLLLSGAVAPNLLGAAFVVAQALAVAALGMLQLTGLRGAASVTA
jgi:hypothetical protein